MSKAADCQILALDVGSKRIGVARASQQVRLVEELAVLPVDDHELERLEELFERWRPAVLVVGLPLDKTGTEGRQATAVKQWVKIMLKRTAFTGRLVWQDETLSSHAAKERTGGIGPVDDVAAAVILEDYLADRSRGI